jgi:hypothetical protein
MHAGGFPLAFYCVESSGLEHCMLGNLPVQVLGQVLRAVNGLHGAGYAHRNILRRLK